MMQLVGALLLGLAAVGECANILALAPSNCYSHFIIIEPLLQELAFRGHNLTVVSIFPQNPPRANYHDINVGHLLNPLQSTVPLDELLKLGVNPFWNMYRIWEFGHTMCQTVLESGDLNGLYSSAQSFDLVITHLFSYECFSVFAHRFNTPIVSVVTSSALPWIHGRVGNPDHPGYIVSNFIDGHEIMTFNQRVVNTLAWLSSAVTTHIWCSRMDQLVRDHLDPSAPPVYDIVSERTSIVLVNSHFSLLQSRPLVPNMLDVAGIHIKPPKPLPKDLQEFLDGASEGAIVFSLGSILRMGTMPQHTVHSFIEAFAVLPQRVVFKFEEELENVPSNILVKRWLPQRDLLGSDWLSGKVRERQRKGKPAAVRSGLYLLIFAIYLRPGQDENLLGRGYGHKEHPNVQLLMAHGGQASTIEAVHTATPVVGLPMFSDQYSNIRFLELKGAAVLLELRKITKDHVLEAVHKVLSDPSYQKNASRLSIQYHDRPLRPLDLAVYWTEYVLRHAGAPQLRSQATDLSWFQYLLMDVISVLLVAVMIVAYIAKVLCKLSIRWISGIFMRTIKLKKT